MVFVVKKIVFIRSSEISILKLKTKNLIEMERNFANNESFWMLSKFCVVILSKLSIT